jgi:hypothetical protein
VFAPADQLGDCPPRPVHTAAGLRAVGHGARHEVFAAKPEPASSLGPGGLCGYFERMEIFADVAAWRDSTLRDDGMRAKPDDRTARPFPTPAPCDDRWHPAAPDCGPEPHPRSRRPVDPNWPHS